MDIVHSHEANTFLSCKSISVIPQDLSRGITMEENTSGGNEITNIHAKILVFPRANFYLFSRLTPGLRTPLTAVRFFLRFGVNFLVVYAC